MPSPLKSTWVFGVEKLFPSRTVGVSLPDKGVLLDNYTQFFSQKTPVEFFGVPLDDNSILHDAPFPEILAECRGVLEEMNKGSIWRSHVDRNVDGQNRCSFYKALASLPPDDQQKCFEKIVECLQRSEGTKHIGGHLLKGRSSFVRCLPLHVPHNNISSLFSFLPTCYILAVFSYFAEVPNGKKNPRQALTGKGKTFFNYFGLLLGMGTFDLQSDHMT